jgi:uncharacterized membrane protein YkoI
MREEPIMRRYCRRLVAVVALGLLVVAAVQADEQKINLDQVPKAVLDAVKAKFPDAKLTGASKETEDGKLIYEVAFSYKDHKYEVECTRDGAFVAIDRQLEVKELPKPVAKALRQKYARAKYNVIEEVTKKDKIEYYEVELTTADKKTVEVLIDPAGKILKEEKKEEKKKEDKKD